MPEFLTLDDLSNVVFADLWRATRPPPKPPEAAQGLCVSTETDACRSAGCVAVDERRRFAKLLRTIAAYGITCWAMTLRLNGSLANVASQPVSTIFDDIPRNPAGRPRAYSESRSTFQFLNSAAGEQWVNARDLLEAWFSDYPDLHKDKLRNRFRSELEGQHLGAWWELYTFTLYQRLGYSVTVEPELPGSTRKIDLLVSRGNESMYIECTVDGAEDSTVTGNPAIEAKICDSINKVHNRSFLIGLEFEAEGTETPSEAEITNALEEWLASLDPDRVTEEIESAHLHGELGALPEKRFSFREWDFTCIAFPNAPDKRYAGGRLLGYHSAKPMWLNDVDRIHDTVKKKGHRYGNLVASLNTPLVVAVLSVAGFAEQEDVTDAMFGRKAVEVRRDDPRSVQVVRQRNGYWRGPSSPRGTRVSGVLFSHDVRPWSVASHLPSLWINPWALNPLSEHEPLGSIIAADDGRIISRDATRTPDGVFGSRSG
jgi:hypothetical protein